MLNYMRAEFYRNFNRVYLWAYTGFFALSAFAINLLASSNKNIPIKVTVLMDITIAMLILPVYFVIPMLDMATAEENKNQTLRNVITFGMPRYKLILSKLITATVLALISALIILVVFYGSGAVLFGLGDNFPSAAADLLQRLLAALPLWIGAIAVGTFLALFINNNNMFSVVYGALFLVLPTVIKMLVYLVSDKFMYIQKILISTQIGKIAAPNASSQDMLSAALIGVGYIVVFTLLSILYFSKKEVK